MNNFDNVKGKLISADAGTEGQDLWELTKDFKSLIYTFDGSIPPVGFIAVTVVSIETHIKEIEDKSLRVVLLFHITPEKLANNISSSIADKLVEFEKVYNKDIILFARSINEELLDRLKKSGRIKTEHVMIRGDL